ncbi:low molecular weight phosphatase family protein [Mycolicibacterium vaccae]|uniref:arsenate reductase/protein-tyrosine-phosphatase family protein n=1 Tax=Mycolicibacterium vaccae TaxID=1810 RepID=UPI003D0882C3
MQVLFVCTGNICRSPTAERLAVSLAAQQGFSGIGMSSAGTRAVIGRPMDPEAALVLEEMGGDASNFAARQLRPRVAAEADLIITMTRAHRESVLELAPRKLNRTFTLAEAATLVERWPVCTLDDLQGVRAQLRTDEAPDIPDPIGRSAEVFAAVGGQIAHHLPPILEVCHRSRVAGDG